MMNRGILVGTGNRLRARGKCAVHKLPIESGWTSAERSPISSPTAPAACCTRPRCRRCPASSGGGSSMPSPRSASSRRRSVRSCTVRRSPPTRCWSARVRRPVWSRPRAFVICSKSARGGVWSGGCSTRSGAGPPRSCPGTAGWRCRNASPRTARWFGHSTVPTSTRWPRRCATRAWRRWRWRCSTATSTTRTSRRSHESSGPACRESRSASPRP